jgi:hypothetical protein
MKSLSLLTVLATLITGCARGDGTNNTNKVVLMETSVLTSNSMTIQTSVYTNLFLVVSQPQTNAGVVTYTLTFSTNKPEDTIPKNLHNELLKQQYFAGFAAGVSNEAHAQLNENMNLRIQRAVQTAVQH